MLDETWHHAFLAALFKALGGGALLELGVGKSQLQAECKAKHYVGVDVNQHSGVTHCMTTDRFFQGYMGRKFDVILVDADHRYAQMIKDLYSAMTLLAPGGIIAVHDTVPIDAEHLAENHCCDSWKLLRNQFDGWGMVTIRRHPGLTLLSRSPTPLWDVEGRS